MNQIRKILLTLFALGSTVFGIEAANTQSNPNFLSRMLNYFRHTGHDFVDRYGQPLKLSHDLEVALKSSAQTAHEAAQGIANHIKNNAVLNIASHRLKKSPRLYTKISYTFSNNNNLTGTAIPDVKQPAGTKYYIKITPTDNDTHNYYSYTPGAWWNKLAYSTQQEFESNESNFNQLEKGASSASQS